MDTRTLTLINELSSEWEKIPVLKDGNFGRVFFTAIKGALRQVKVISVMYRFGKHRSGCSDNSTLTIRMMVAGVDGYVDHEMPLEYLTKGTGAYFYKDICPRFYLSTLNYKENKYEDVWETHNLFDIVSMAMRKPICEIAEVEVDKAHTYPHFRGRQYRWDGVKAVRQYLTIPQNYVHCEHGMLFEDKDGYGITMPNGVYPTKAACEQANEIEVVCFRNAFQIAEKVEASEDERMVKLIKEQLLNIKQTITENYELDAKLTKAIDWLENQCESDEAKAKMLLIDKGYPIDANGVFPTYEEMYNIIKEGLEHQGALKPNGKVEPKFNVGDTMRTLQEASNGITDGMPVVVSIDDEYYHCTNELIAIKDQDDYEFPPINMKQKPADKVEKAMAEADYEWDFVNNELRKIEKKDEEEQQ